MMKAIFHKSRQLLGFFTEYATDMWLYLRHNGYSPWESRALRREYKTVIETHTVEKGLSLANPRPFFGEAKIKALLDDRQKDEPEMTFASQMLAGALNDYVIFNRSFAQAAESASGGGASLLDRATEYVVSEEERGCVLTGGVRAVLDPPSSIDQHAVDFLESRFACRVFDPTPMTAEEVEAVTSLAQRAPSQCNRQSSILHVFRDRASIEALLALQGGARGFVDDVGTLFIVSSELTAWGGPQQRNQPYVDGALFAMMLMLSLQAYGFASCPLNLAVGNGLEGRIKSAAGIPRRQRLIMMIAAGRPGAATVKAAKSPRRPISEVLQIH